MEEIETTAEIMAKYAERKELRIAQNESLRMTKQEQRNAEREDILQCLEEDKARRQEGERRKKEMLKLAQEARPEPSDKEISLPSQKT